MSFQPGKVGDVTNASAPDGWSEPTLSDCWAKTDSAGNPALPLLEHCLNVGAVAEAILPLLPKTIRTFLGRNAIRFAAAHDIGKATPGFQLKSPGWRGLWQKRLGLIDDSFYERNHSRLGQSALHRVDTELRIGLKRGVLAIGGHHGVYTGHLSSIRVGPEGENAWPALLRKELIEELAGAFGTFEADSYTAADWRVHLLTGFITFSDWIGSNERWFPLGDQRLEDGMALERARTRARQAVAELQIGRWRVLPDKTFPQLFAPAPEIPFEPRPLQSILREVTDAPGLYIVEAPMGEGKTEAALLAAYRRWTEGDARGLFFGLPTQLTSSRIHQRLLPFLERTLENESLLALVHGNAWLEEDRLMPVHPTDLTESGAADANAWFADARRALLAPFGIGTVDQVLLSVLAVKHSAVRFFGLAGKVVVLDEVHSYDPYASELLDRAVEWLVAAGSTVLVLSATLTHERRQKLIQRITKDALPVTAPYPSITKVLPANPPQIHRLPASNRKPLEVAITCSSPDEDAFLPLISAAAEAGACVVIIRNTVATAQDTYRAVCSACRDRGLTLGLLHSRFPRFQRDQNEASWTAWLGKGEAQRPRGAVLVATQVVEQSLDIDADLLASELAPTDLLLQRLGRLHRHPRLRPRTVVEPRFVLLNPSVDWEGSKSLIRSQLGPSSYVYPPFALYQAQTTWSSMTTIRLPEEIQSTLESSAAIRDPLPSGAAAWRDEVDREVREMISTALSRGPFREAGDDTDEARTRWGKIRDAPLVLLRDRPVSRGGQVELAFADGSCHFHCIGRFDFELARKLHRNTVRIPRYATERARKDGPIPDWLDQHMPAAIYGVWDAGTPEVALLGDAGVGDYALSYTTEIGLTLERRARTNPRIGVGDDESWF